MKYFGARVTGTLIERNRTCAAILQFMRVDPGREWGVSDMTRLHRATRVELKACLRRLVLEGSVLVVRQGTMTDETLYRLIPPTIGPPGPGAA